MSIRHLANWLLADCRSIFNCYPDFALQSPKASEQKDLPLAKVAFAQAAIKYILSSSLMATNRKVRKIFNEILG